jgi:hypothetical protein
MIRWAIKISSNNQLDGYREHFACAGGTYELFETREGARLHIKDKYGWHTRHDLRREPHGWKAPKPVRVKVQLIPTQVA